MRTSILLSDNVVLLAGVTAVIIGSSLLLVGRRWRACHGSRAALVVHIGLLAAVGLAVLLASATLALPCLGLANLWLAGWAGRSSFGTACLRRIFTVPGNHHVQSCLLIVLGFGSLLGYVESLDAQVPEWGEGKQHAVMNPPRKPLPPPAHTDRGCPIDLYPRNSPDLPCYSLENEERYIQQKGLQLNLIRTGMPTQDSNCHGWVFTGGKFSLGGEAVEQVLADNYYAAVTCPQAGDLVVYRSSGGEILHSGIVRVAALDGLILVESKFSMFGRFLHRPEDQPFSQLWQFYSSPRKGHLLHDLPDAPVSPPDPQHPAI